VLGAVVAVIVLLIIGASRVRTRRSCLAAAIVVLGICTRLFRWRFHGHHHHPHRHRGAAMTLPAHAKHGRRGGRVAASSRSWS
jgi:hypothetical protein